MAAIFDIAHRLRIAAPKHLGHQAIVVGRLVAGMGVLKRIPVIGKDLFEDVPVPRGCCKHQGAPSEGVGIVAVQRLYHASSALSTPPRRSRGHPHPPHLPWCYEDFWGLS